MYSSRFDIHKIKNPSNDLLGKHKEKNLINPTIKINDKNQYISKLYEKLNTSRKYYFNLYFSAEISLVMGGLGDAKKKSPRTLSNQSFKRMHSEYILYNKIKDELEKLGEPEIKDLPTTKELKKIGKEKEKMEKKKDAENEEKRITQTQKAYVPFIVKKKKIKKKSIL